MQCNQTIEERFEELYMKYKNIVYRTSLHYTKNAHEAEDITQKIFCHLFEYLDYVNDDNLEGYLVTTARNLSFNWLRDTKREREGVCFEDLTDDSLKIQSAEHTYLQKEKDENVMEFSSELLRCVYEENESWYHIIYLIYGLGVSCEDAAKMLKISKSVLYSKLYRAKKWIKKHFHEKFKDL